MLLLLSTVWFSCDKSKTFEAEVTGAFQVTYNSAILEIDYFLNQLGNKSHPCGICWSTSPDPVSTDSHISDNIMASDERDYELTDLDDSTVYHARAFIVTKNGTIVYSDDFSFTTLLAPQPPCTVTENTIFFEPDSGGSFTQDGLSANFIYDTYYEQWKVFMTIPMGEFEFLFTQPPTTGIYKTAYEGGFLEGDQVEPQIMLSESFFNCTFGTPEYQDVYIIDNEDGTFTLSFCDFHITPDGAAGCVEEYTVDGKITVDY